MEVKLCLLAAIIQLGGSFPVAGSLLDYPVGKTFRYTYTSQTMLNEPGPHAQLPKQKDVGFKFSATVELTAVWRSTEALLMKVSLSSPRLHSVARPDVARDLYGLPKLPVFFHWLHGKVGRVFAAEEESTLALNIKKGVISLFQIRMEEGSYEEVDASGECATLYTKKDATITKTKTDCKTIETTGQYSSVNPAFDVSVVQSAQTTYDLTDDVIRSISAEESHVISLNLQDTLTSAVSVRQEMKLETSSQGGAGMQGSTVEEVVKKISQAYNFELYGMMLDTSFEVKQCSVDCVPVQDLVNKLKADLQKERIGSVEAAYAYVELVDTLRGSPKDAILALLKNEENKDIIGALIDAAAGAQTTSSQAALMAFLDFNEGYYIELPERYLLATAFATHPSETLLNDMLELYKRNVADDKLRESIGEALGAILNAHSKAPEHADSKIVKEILSTIVETLEKCEDETCQLFNLRALTNAGIPETIPLLLTTAESAKQASVSEAAIKGLRRMRREDIGRAEVRDVMKRIFHQKKRGYDSAVRTRALGVLLATSPSEEELHQILLETTNPYNTEFDMFVQARVFNLMEGDDKVRKMVEESMKDGNLSNWDVLAPKGKSLAFTSSMAEMSSGTADYFMYVENARSGVMKRSGMDVELTTPAQKLPMYSVGLFAAGLEGLLGEEVEAGQEEVDATAGMALDMIDVSLRPITFFKGSSGLMSAVWNAPSDLTSALQTNILLLDHSARVHLQNGLIVELDVRGGVSMDLSGSLTVSLWNKNAKSLIKNTGALAIRGSTRILTSSFRTGVVFTADAQAAIDFKSDVDFYDGIKSCLQMERPDFIYRHNVTKFEHARGFRKGYISRVKRLRKIEAVSLPLPPRNAKVCRVLLADTS